MARAKLFGVTAMVAVMAGGAASAETVLNFENIAKTYPFANNTIQILNYYNGGAASNGSVGPSDGVVFSSNALVLCLNSQTVTCSNTSRGGLAPGSAKGALFFLSGTSTTMDVAAGFSTGFSFNYSEPNTHGGNVQVWSGLDGTGTLLQTINLGLTPSGACPGYPGAYCPFVPIGVTFAGVAKSVSFGGVANYVVFDDVTFGESHPGVPEPDTWALMLAGLAGAGGALRARRAMKAVEA